MYLWPLAIRWRLRAEAETRQPSSVSAFQGQLARCSFLSEAPIKTVEGHPEYQRWATFFAAMVEHVSQEAGLPVPEWVTQQEYILTTPWYLYRGKRPEWLAFQEVPPPELARQ